MNTYKSQNHHRTRKTGCRIQTLNFNNITLFLDLFNRKVKIADIITNVAQHYVIFCSANF